MFIQTNITIIQNITSFMDLYSPSWEIKWLKPLDFAKSFLIANLAFRDKIEKDFNEYVDNQDSNLPLQISDLDFWMIISAFLFYLKHVDGIKFYDIKMGNLI